MMFDGTLKMGAMAAEVRLRERDCALSRADWTVTGGRRKAWAAPGEDEDALETPMIFSMLKDGLFEGSDLIMDAVLRLFSCSWRLGLSCELNAFLFSSAEDRRGTPGGSM